MELKEVEALSILQGFSEENVAVSFSGGKDSLVALDLAERVGIKEAIFVDTTIEFEETLEYLELVKDFYDIQLKIVRAPIEFFDIIEVFGMPSRRFRWCCDVFKFGPLAEYAQENGIQGFITGLRREESNKRRNYKKIDRNPLVPYLQINPLLNWTEEDIWNYIKKYNLPPNPLYEHFDRLGCWCCPFRTERDWNQIEKHFPEKIDYLNKKLNFIADKFNIKDKEQYISNKKWTYWVFPSKKITTTGLSISEQNDKKEIEIYFLENDGILVNKIIEKNLLYTICDNFEKKDNKILIKGENLDINKFKSYIGRIIGKALNCAGCGACLFLCNNNALEVSNGEIYIDKLKCKNCGRCLLTKPLRGSCVFRNYAPKKASFVTITEE
jgi:phosphoadenosine phosphosulfate reductase